jgi:hypothetical protein
MSDEYASSGLQGSLVNPSISDTLPPPERESYLPSSDYATKNYPPPGDTTSSGGRRTGPVPQPESGQPPGGGGGADLRRQQQRDAPQGRDPSAESLDTRKEAAEALAARYRASRERLHEGYGSGVDVVGA